MTNDLTPTHRLRVTAGPLAGAAYILRESFTLGRSSYCDVLLLDGEVSRLHARIVSLGDGRHRVRDLGSANGTWIGGHRIDEHVLRDGDELRIGGHRFVFEPLPGQDRSTADLSGVYAVRARPGRPVERTVVGGIAADAHARAARARLDAVDPHGVRYLGDLVGDVVLYRNLLMRKLRGEELSEATRDRLATLEGGLRRADATGDDGYIPFSCQFPARVRRVGERLARETPVEVVHFGAGGARIRSHEPLRRDEVASLVIDLISPGGPRTLAFVARVGSGTAPEYELLFSGGPGWTQRYATSDRFPTLTHGRCRDTGTDAD